MTVDLPRCEPRAGIEKLTEHGICHAKIDLDIFRAIKQFHRQSRGRIERIPGDFVSTGSGDIASYLNELPDDLKQRIHAYMQPLLEAWVNRPLRPTWVYGVRTYLRGAVLKMHRDKDYSHVVSAIMNIAQEADTPWPLQMEGEADGEPWRELYLEPGEMVFYESMRLNHARITPFHGDSFSNVFVHFALK